MDCIFIGKGLGRGRFEPSYMTGPIEIRFTSLRNKKTWQAKDGMKWEPAKLEPLDCQADGSMPAKHIEVHGSFVKYEGYFLLYPRVSST